MDPDRLAELQRAIDSRKLAVHSFLVIRHGYIVAESYYPPYGPDTPHQVYSCAKSIASALVGIAIAEGYLEGLDQPVLELFPGRTFTNVDERKQALTLEHLLTMTAGLDWQDTDATFSRLYYSDDWVQFMLDRPMVETPGRRFNYCSGCSHLLSAMIQEKTGSTLDFAQSRLFEPLGISSARWQTDPQGIPIGGWGLEITPRDMARLGYLYLHQGVWDGRQVVPAEWVEASTQKQTASDDWLDYGYQWWVYTTQPAAFVARGRDAQLVVVRPDLDLVVVFTADIQEDRVLFDLIEEYVVPAVRL
jgi:CubicO group peptidase (beta-lactamase class C family)